MAAQYLSIQEVSKSDSGKTSKFEVKSGDLLLGNIYFFGRWRKYCFYPCQDMAFDYLCLNQIYEFCVKEINKVFKRV